MRQHEAIQQAAVRLDAVRSGNGTGRMRQQEGTPVARVADSDAAARAKPNHGGRERRRERDKRIERRFLEQRPTIAE